MNDHRLKLPIAEIKVENRLRQDYGDLDSLKESIRNYGLIQPVVINQDKRLIAGGRRLRCCLDLGMADIDVVYRETLSEDELHELELEENSKRLDQPWTERCIAIAYIHELKQRRSALEGWKWTMRESCALYGMSLGSLDYILKVAKKLVAERSLPLDQRRFHQFSSAAEAYRLGIVRDEEERVQALLAERHRANAVATTTQKHEQEIVKQVETASTDATAFAAERRRYESNPLNTVPFDEYWRAKTAEVERIKTTIYLSNVLLHADCIPYMLDPDNAGMFDHIITDIPYGIDMDMLNQQNPHGGLRDLDTVKKEHDVDENLDLIARFYPAAFACTKPSAFVITFCDIMNWQFMYDCAVKAGFAVQRWPFEWLKGPGCMNQCASFNMTKATEPAIVARKPGSTLASQVGLNYLAADNGPACKDTGHKFAKPYEVTRLFTNAVSHKGQLILEPFAGRGSMVIEMLRQERRIVAIEKNEVHYNALLENVKRYYLTLNPNYVFK